jgi:hypothetical protein
MAEAKTRRGRTKKDSFFTSLSKRRRKLGYHEVGTCWLDREIASQGLRAGESRA